MSQEGCVTIECSVVLVRLHDRPAKFGEYAPYSDAFTMIMVEPGVYEVKLARGVVMTKSQRISLAKQLTPLGAKKAFYDRHKPGKEPYRIWIDGEKLLEKANNGSADL